ncbi:hypothetical protein PVAND_006632 [Polypedilum vanderplanki]|uniref:sphingomyelin phosphodiesterase n=1 Tax=Polypedilum vanderplanki TaxID=319348 RepID=A0A9J6C3U9_POLVA|nr:hypothetical protein PVAND_006632 [Polypedilum vanderplanki]
MVLTISVLTMNVWGIPFISADKDIRIEKISEHLVTSEYDVISLQEVWSEYDFQKIRDKLSKKYPYAHYFYSGVFGSGLCVFSKHQIISVFFHHWALNGYVHKIQHADWFGGKGVGLCRLKVNDKIVNFYTAHLHAEYDKLRDDYVTHRIIQAFDTAQFLENTRGNCSLQILAGDLNTEPNDLAYRILLSVSGMKDSFVQNTEVQPYFATSDYINNSYTKVKNANGKEGVRIDYVLYREGNDSVSNVEKYEMPLLEKIPDYNISYSDHEAVHAKIIIIPKKENELFSSGVDQILTIQNNIKNLKECIATCNQSLKTIESHRCSYSLMAIGLLVILLNILEISPSYGFKTVYLIIKFLIISLILFLIFMATIWNVMEKHGILSGKLAMQITLKNSEIIMENINN